MEINQLMIILYTKIFPFTSMFLTGLLLYFLLFAPSCIKTMIKAWRSRGAGALMFLANDDGFVNVEWMKTDMGQGIFTGKNTKYVITPRPRYIPQITDEKHPLYKLDPNGKEKIDQLIQTRHILEGLGKPTYFGYKSKSIAISPSLLLAMNHAPTDKTEISTPPRPPSAIFDLEQHPFNNQSQSEPAPAISLLDARIIKQYVPFTFSPSLIDALTFKHEQIGYFSRPMDKLKQNIIPAGLVIVLLFAAYMIMTGKIRIPGLN